MADDTPRFDDTASFLPVGAGPDTPPPEVVVGFPVVLRGYDRDAVDAHLAALAQEVAELHAQRSPHAAVQRALDKVGEETSDILRHAHRTADEITTKSRTRAAERVEQAEREATRIRAEADQHVRSLDESVDTIWSERHRLVEDVRRVGETLLKVSDEALQRFPPEEGPPTPSKPIPVGTGPATAAGRGDTAEEEIVETDEEELVTDEEDFAAEEDARERDPQDTVLMEPPPEVEPDVSEGIQSIRPMKRD